MLPCPCCGHRTLPARGDYDVCPVCGWEDEGSEPWEVSGANGRTLVEAQQEYLARRLPHRLRRGRVRAPRRHEARHPEWRPFELTDELVRRVRESHQEWERSFDVPGAAAEDPADGPMAEYNAALRLLVADAAHLPHPEIETRLQRLTGAHGLALSPGQVELLARLLKDERYYRRSPLRTAWWLLRHARPTTLRRRWTELRSGRVHFAG